MVAKYHGVYSSGTLHWVKYVGSNCADGILIYICFTWYIMSLPIGSYPWMFPPNTLTLLKQCGRMTYQRAIIFNPVIVINLDLNQFRMGVSLQCPDGTSKLPGVIDQFNLWVENCGRGRTNEAKYSPGSSASNREEDWRFHCGALWLPFPSGPVPENGLDRN